MSKQEKKPINLGLIGAFVAITIAVLALAMAGQVMTTMLTTDDVILIIKNNPQLFPTTEPYDPTDIMTALGQLEVKVNDNRAEYTREIVQVKKDLQKAQIGTGDPEREGLNVQRGTGTSPILTITLEATEYIKGEIIFIEGTGNPGQPITATMCLPTEEFKICPKRTVHGQIDKRGTYTMGFSTTFDDPLGIWNLFVKSDGETSETLSFILK